MFFFPSTLLASIIQLCNNHKQMRPWSRCLWCCYYFNDFRLLYQEQKKKHVESDCQLSETQKRFSSFTLDEQRPLASKSYFQLNLTWCSTRCPMQSKSWPCSSVSWFYLLAEFLQMLLCLQTLLLFPIWPSNLFAPAQIRQWGNVEWAHDYDMYELRARTAAGTLFVHLSSESSTVKRKLMQDWEGQAPCRKLLVCTQQICPQMEVLPGHLCLSMCLNPCRPTQNISDLSATTAASVICYRVISLQ